MTPNELLRVQLLIAKARVSARDTEIADLNKAFDLAVEIACFWRDQAADGTELPPELKAKLDAGALP